MRILLLCFFIFLSLTGVAQTPQYSFVGGNSNNSWPFNGTTAALNSNKVQWVYRSSDFPTAPSGIITDVYFKLSGTAISGTPTYTNLDIKMGPTSLTDFPAGATSFITGLQQVFFSANYAMTGAVPNGWVKVTLQSPFFYSNTQNFIIEVSQQAFTNGFTTPQTLTNGTRRIYAQWNSPTGTGNTGLADFGFDIVTTYYPNATGGGTFCAGDSTKLIATAPGKQVISYYWIDNKGNYIFSPTIDLNNLDTSNTGYYNAYVIYDPGFGLPIDTSGATQVGVNVNPIPPKPLVAPVIVFCEGEDFDSIPIHGKNLKWYSVPTGGIPLLVPPVINTGQGGSATYYVSQTLNNCEGPRAAVTINVVPKPTAPQVVSPVRYCQGDIAVPLSALGQNIRWYSVATGGVGTPVIPTPTTNAQGTFMWYVTQTVAGCESVRVPVEVSVSYLPNALVLLSKPYVCQYDTLTLTYFGNANTLADYIWTLPKGASVDSGSGQGPLVVRFDSAGLLTVRLTVDNKGCVGPEATVNVPVRLSPRFSLDLQENACQGDIVNLAVTNSTTGIDKYEWYGFAGGEIVYGSVTKGPYGIRWNTPGVKIIDVLATDEECKSLPFSDTITIHELPDAKISLSKNNICTGDTIEFRAAYEQGNSYHWEPFQFFGPSHSNIDSGVVDFGGLVRLQVTNRFNCTAVDSILINAKPCCDIYFPNAFTPNNDGRNDKFQAVTAGTHQISVLRVQNRWGQTVFETGNELNGWDGNFNGKPQDMGTYFFYIKYKCSDGNFYEDKGEVMLIR
jgi:gliding motility-associated-like protein